MTSALVGRKVARTWAGCPPKVVGTIVAVDYNQASDRFVLLVLKDDGTFTDDSTYNFVVVDD